MWTAWSKSCLDVAASQSEVRERQRLEWRGRSRLGSAVPRRAWLPGTATEERPRHLWHCPTAASRYPSEKISGELAFAGSRARRIDRNAIVPSLRLKMSGKMGGYAVPPPSNAVQTMTLAVHFVFPPIFAVTRSTKGCWKASLGAAV